MCDHGCDCPECVAEWGFAKGLALAIALSVVLWCGVGLALAWAFDWWPWA